MTTLSGYHGRVLRVDLSTRTSFVVDLSHDILQSFVGGTGLGTWLLLEHCPDNVDPLSPDAPLLFVFSPLVGSPLTTSAKFAVMAKSPLTQRINDSLSSSSFAIAGKKTGFDALIIVGSASSLTHLVIDESNVRFEVATDERGLSSEQTEQRVRSRFGSSFRVAAIGPAGEQLVRYATISNEGRHAGRGGLGAVMGGKQLKSVAVRGSQLVDFAFPDELIACSRELSKRSLGPATAKYRELGTVSNLLTFNRLGTLPTRNFQASTFDAVELLAPETISQTHARTRASCAACTIGCEHIFRSHSSNRPGVRLEYENVFALGPLCGVHDVDTVLEASRLCDELGLDTVSTGGTIAFAMECSERGLLDAPELRFGNGSALLQCVRDIASRSGPFGDLLAEGSRIAAEQIGGGSDRFAPHVKGLEIPGYEPRTLQTMALGLAVGTRGADHNRSGAYQVDFSDQVDRLNVGLDAVPLAVATENEAALMDSLILCKFLRGVFDNRLAEMATMLRLVTGFDLSVADMTETASRIVTARKRFNIRQGWTPAEDTLPERFFAEPLGDGPGRGTVLNRERLAAMIRRYNELRGWTADGWIANEDSSKKTTAAET
ncbi:MAG: aldehyde ferredoxin oxidoreductase family protein [Planctomycetota bacterium]|jgi:aldehyde:ferredoxin oxidoreductase